MIKIYSHISELVTLSSAYKKDGRRLHLEDLSIIRDGAVAFDHDKILWVGSTKDIPNNFSSYPQINLSGHVLTPELVDSHTHLVFGGNRAEEYSERLSGVSYEEIAKRGGGILLTVKKTNELSKEALFQSACERIERIYSFGIGTIEIKSGYGLTFEKELEISKIIDDLKNKYSPKIQIIRTTLAAHDIPKKFKSSHEYIKEVAIPVLEKLALEKLVDNVDIFHEKNYFSDEDVRLIASTAHKHKVHIKLHADELNDNDGARLSVELEALSADHLLKISASGIKALSESKTVATLLPGTAFFLGKPLAPARALLDAGVKVAIASDYNPGSSHIDNLLLVASISAAQLKMNQAELWAAITLNASAALGLNSQGAIEVGLLPRFSLFKTSSISEITYSWGKNFSTILP